MHLAVLTTWPENGLTSSCGGFEVSFQSFAHIPYIPNMPNMCLSVWIQAALDPRGRVQTDCRRVVTAHCDSGLECINCCWDLPSHISPVGRVGTRKIQDSRIYIFGWPFARNNTSRIISFFWFCMECKEMTRLRLDAGVNRRVHEGA